MAGSGESERAVAGSGDGGNRPLLHSLDYPCTTRLRLRRLLACIRVHGHVDVHLAAEQPVPCCTHWVQALCKNRKQQPADLAQFYLQMKKRLSSLSQEADNSNSESTMVRGEQLIALFDTCFEAGRRLGLEQGKFPEVLSKEGFPYLLARGFKVVSSKKAKLSSKPDTAQVCCCGLGIYACSRKKKLTHASCTRYS